MVVFCKICRLKQAAILLYTLCPFSLMEIILYLFHLTRYDGVQEDVRSWKFYISIITPKIIIIFHFSFLFGTLSSQRWHWKRLKGRKREFVYYSVDRCFQFELPVMLTECLWGLLKGNVFHMQPVNTASRQWGADKSFPIPVDHISPTDSDPVAHCNVVKCSH